MTILKDEEGNLYEFVHSVGYEIGLGEPTYKIRKLPKKRVPFENIDSYVKSIMLHYEGVMPNGLASELRSLCRCIVYEAIAQMEEKAK